MKFKFSLVKTAALNWYRNDPFSQSAAIAYYTIFSFPALVLIYLTLASLFASKEELQHQVLLYIQNIVGKSDAKNVQSIIQNTAPTYQNSWAIVIGGGVLLFAGLKLFLQLQKTLNMIWRVEAGEHSNFFSVVKQRVVSLGVMLAIGFVILTSLMMTVALGTIGEWVSANVSESLLGLIHVLNFFFSLLTITILFTILLKLLPDVKVPWRFSFIGGGVSALLFVVGEYGLSLYFRLAQPQSAYGVTGCIILLMLWVSYACVILLFGAELSKVMLEYNTEEKAKPKRRGVKKVRGKSNKI